MSNGKKLYQGVGIRDNDYPVIHKKTVEGKRVVVWECPYYKKWTQMLDRCYSPHAHKVNRNYEECSVYSSWLTFSNFKKWMKTQDWEGMDLDKDLLVKGNKIYSPETCTFITPRLNSIINTKKGSHMLGAEYREQNKKYCVRIKSKGFVKYFGCHQTEELAHNAWQKGKITELEDVLKHEKCTRAISMLVKIIDKLKYESSKGLETIEICGGIE